MNRMTPLTQKAQGIVAITDGCRGISLLGPGEPLMVIPGDIADCMTSAITWPMFARPCPFRPRHGFVNSRLVSSWEQVITLLQRASNADPKNPVELVLAPLLTGTVSAVATNAGVTWGRGNDGVTAGKDPRALLITVKTSNLAWNKAVRNIIYEMDTNFDVPKFPYLEIVEDDDDMRLVQVRDGPKQPEGANHVIRKVTVKYVLKASPAIDLLDWEGKVRRALLVKGVVIWAPGMSLASHFCVHGIENGIPVITDHEVNVGDLIQPTKNRTSTLRKHNYAKIATLITEGLSHDLCLSAQESQKNAILTAMATTQAQFCWGREPHLLRLRGLSIPVLLKAVLASCAGEIRHWDTPDGPGRGKPSLHNIIKGIANSRYHRNRIYNAIFNSGFTFSKIEDSLEAAECDLGHSGWARSFGGSRWAMVAATGIELVKMARRFCDRPCAASWSKVVQSANRLINTSHNNGKCLTKWVDVYAMEMISLSPTMGFLNPYVPQVALNMTKDGEKT